MKIILSLLLIIILNSASAKNYYFSAVSGDDSRTPLQAQSSLTPWKTLDKLNAFFSDIQPGDSVLFKCGETFYGSIIVSQSGTVSQPIVFGAYGTGNKPVITGLQTLSGWSSSGGGKYVSYNSLLGEVVNVVSLNGVEQAMGRYPNSNAGNDGYLVFKSHGFNFITDDQLPASPTWTGAELVVRTNRFVLDRVKVTSHSGTKIFYSPDLSYDPTDGFGYFIQNDIKTLDQPGEWFYDPATNKMNMYFGDTPVSAYDIKASAVRNVVSVFNKDNIVFDNLAITGANFFDFYLYSTDNIVIKNCSISLAGVDAINVSHATNLKVENSAINTSNNIGINLNNCFNSLIQNNDIRNTALIQGLGKNSSNKSVAIRETGANNTIEYNQIDSTGYSAIRFEGDYCLIKNNFINHFNLTKDDGGGIYTGSLFGGIPHFGSKIIGNIILNGSGAAAGTIYKIAASTTGIYMDDYAANVEITGNTVAYCSRSGTFLHNAHDITLLNNTFFNSPTQLVMTHDFLAVTSPLRNIIAKNNILFSKKESELVFAINSTKDDLSSSGIIDSNYYCRPLDDNFVIKTSYFNSQDVRVTQNLDLKSWQTIYKEDKSSKNTAVQIIPYKLNNLLGSNKFTNGDFSANISGANVYSTATKFSTSWVSNKLDKGTFQGIVSSPTPCVYSISVPIGTVKPGKNYLVSFSVQNSNDTVMNVFVRQPSSPYNILSNAGVKNFLKIGPERKDYELSFSPQTSESNPILVFETNSQEHSIWLDNIKVYEADVAVTNPDDSIRFEYNATQSTKSVPLAGTYIDARGTVYANKIVLEPYTSAILIRKSSGEIPEPTVKISNPAINSRYIGSPTVRITAIASDARETISKVEFYNGTTLLHTEFVEPFSFLWKTIPVGQYSLTARAINKNGKITTSAVVPFSVVKPPNTSVTITSPAANSNFISSSIIKLAATTGNINDKIKMVGFYKGTELLHTEYVSPYTFSWANVPEGKYVITAKATDEEGNVSTSESVTVSVVKPSISKGVINSVLPLSGLSMSSPGKSGLLSVVNDGLAGSTVSNLTPGNGNGLTTHDFNLFPNPAINKVGMYFDEFQSNQKANVSIVDLLGKTIQNMPVTFSGKKIEVDVSSISAGMYILRFSSDNIVVNKKFVKGK